MCKYFTCEGTQTAIIENGVVGLAITDEFEAWLGNIWRCEILVGDEIFDADPADLTVLQPGGANVV